MNGPAYPEWRPIESAPKDGTRLLLTDGDLIAIGAWRRDSYFSDWTNEACPVPTDGPGAEAGYWLRHPTHWAALSDQPTRQEDA